MSLRFKKNINYNAIIGVWQIDPDILAYSDELKLNDSQLKRLSSFGTERKKAEFLSVCKLVQEMLEEETPVEIKHHENGKPFIEGFNYNISITHSGKFVAVLLAKESVPGIDIEKVSEKIVRIEDKFMNEDELKSAEGDGDNMKAHKVLVWTIKEAMFKFYGDGKVIFKENLLVEPFTFEESGVVGVTLKINTIRKLAAHYEKIEDYILTYVLG